MAANRPQPEQASLSQSQGDRSSVLHRQRGHIQQNAMLAAGRNQHHRGNLNPSVADTAIPQDPHHINAIHYDDDVAYYHDHPQAPGPPPDGLVFPYMLHDVGFPQGFPAQPEGIGHEPDGTYHLDHTAPDVAPPAGPAQAALPDPFFHHAPPPDPLVTEYCLRRLASRSLLHPNSEIVMVRIERGSAAGRFTVVISLDTPANFFF